jgi:hypothetical protein
MNAFVKPQSTLWRHGHGARWQILGRMTFQLSLIDP